MRDVDAGVYARREGGGILFGIYEANCREFGADVEMLNRYGFNITYARANIDRQILPAPVSFVDIAGIVKGASEGAGLGNKFLANIRECDANCQVIRVFTDPDVVHVEGKVDPKDDIETINTELILADLQTLEKALPRLQKEARMNKERAGVLAAAEEALRFHQLVGAS